MSHKSTPGSESIYDVRMFGLSKMLVLGFQHLFAMFGATVLVPILVQGYGLPLSIQTALSLAGTGTLFFHICTRLKVSAFLDSSSAYLGGFSAVATLDPSAYAIMGLFVKLQYARGGIVVAGLLYVILVVITRLVGIKKVMRFPPPVTIGPVIILIGLNLAPNAVSNALSYWWLALLSIAVIVAANVWGKGMVKIIPILLGVVIPYPVAVAVNALGVTAVDVFGSVISLMDLSAVAATVLIGLQPFFTDFTGSIVRFDVTSILVIAPIAVVVMMEYIGDMSAVFAAVGENFLERPGLHHTLTGNGIATSLVGLFGSPANTIYGENVGVLVLFRAYDPKVAHLAAVYTVVLSFSPVFAALANSIPIAITGGVSFTLYGMIFAIGVRNVMENRVDFTNSRNLIIAAVILVRGLGSSGGTTFPVGGAHVTLTNLAVVAIAGITLSATPPGKSYEFGSDVTEGRSGGFGRY